MTAQSQRVILRQLNQIMLLDTRNISYTLIITFILYIFTISNMKYDKDMKFFCRVSQRPSQPPTLTVSQHHSTEGIVFDKQ